MRKKYTDKYWNFIINDSLVLAKEPVCIDKSNSNQSFIYQDNHLFTFDEWKDLAACSNWRHIPTSEESYEIIKFFEELLKGEKEFTVRNNNEIHSNEIHWSKIWLELSKMLWLGAYDYRPVKINDFFDNRTKAFWTNENRYGSGENKSILMIEPDNISNYMSSWIRNWLWVWLVCNSKDKEFNLDWNYVYIQ